MDIEHPSWDKYMERFQEIAEMADEVPRPAPPLDTTKFYLCLYGENGFPPEEELSILETIARQENIKRVEVDTSYWQDTVLFVP